MNVIKAINFTKKGDTYYYHYKYSDLKEFVLYAKNNGGGNGFILTQSNGKYFTYRGYGTIQSASEKLLTISVEHCYIWDGKKLEGQEYIDKQNETYPPLLGDHKMVFLDFNKP